MSPEIVVVTGAGSGIGRAVAVEFARRQAHVVVTDIDMAGAERTALLCNAVGGSAEVHRMDVRDPARVQAVADDVHARHGAVDVLVNNAGVAAVGGFLHHDLEDWEWLVSINLMGVVHGCRSFLPPMKERGRGHVVNVSSAAGFTPSKELPAYCATKFAVYGLSRSLRIELRRHGIGVTTLCPGFIHTHITRGLRLVGADPSMRRTIVGSLRRRDFAPEDVAKAVVRAVDRNRGVVLVTAEAWALYLGTRFAPRLLERLATLQTALSAA